MTEFGKLLIEWYQNNKRPLPWRQTTDPYRIWISEIILQQTRVAQGIDYYRRFVNIFPDIQSLATAGEDEVLRLWQGLGYYSRARNMHQAAKTIVEKFDGKFPSGYKEIIGLKGIGPYTAAAIASFAFNLPYAVLDGNVYRFLARVKGIDTPIDTTEGKKRFEKLANDLLIPTNPGGHNQAMMEIGALICKPQNPDCFNCPFHNTCAAFQTGQTSTLPVKSRKVKQRHRYFLYFYVTPKPDTILINKRNGKDIWQNLYQLPLLETSEKIPETELKKRVSGPLNLLKETSHILSHQVIHTRFFKSNKKTLSLLGLHEVEEVSIKQCSAYAFPQLIVNFLEEQNLPDYGTP